MNRLFNERKEELKAFRDIFFKSGKREEKKADIPDDLFIACPECGKSFPRAQLEDNLFVCPVCSHHLRVGAYDRIGQICDSFRESNKNLVASDEDSFPGYREKLEKARKKSGLQEACVTGTGKIGENRFVICVMDPAFMMGSMGQAVGEKIVRAIEMAVHKHLPLVIFTASGGARMQEGILSLVQMARTSAALERLAGEHLLYITVLTDPTTGGVSASFAMLGDIILAEPDALVGFAGKRVIASTVREELPDDFQQAEFVQEKGFIDRIVPRAELKNEISRLIRLHERRGQWS
ncbi:MAG: acetyl-CoA carboxylase, carboxyltransferase subunit beta [Eubacteriaceae bacterium]|jgi:acetyl-CoA carboxylase carboxyl transferase subunit beta